MKKTKRTIGSLLAVLAILAMSLASVASVAAQATPGATPGPGAEKVTNVALITPASATNLGWDQQGVAGIEAVGKKLNIKVEIKDNGGYDDITPALKDLKSQGAQLIICHASGYQTVCPDFAAQENVKVAVIENEKAVKPGLVSDIETQAEAGAYLAGVAAGKTTKTGTVAVVVSGEPPTWNYMTVGFAEGLKATNGSAKLIYSVIGDAAYDDSAGAKRVTEQVLAAGADVVFGMGDGASFGMIEAIRDFNKSHASAPAKFIDVIGDKSKDYSDVLLTSVLFDYSGIYEQMINDIEMGTFGKTYTMSVTNGGVKLLPLIGSNEQSIQDAVNTAQSDITSGKIKVDAIGDSAGLHDKLKELGYS